MTYREAQDIVIRETFVASAAESIIAGNLPADWSEEDQLALETAVREADSRIEDELD